LAVLFGVVSEGKDAGRYQLSWAGLETQIPGSGEKSGSAAFGEDFFGIRVDEPEFTAEPGTLFKVELEPLGESDVDTFAEPTSMKLTDGPAIEF